MEHNGDDELDQGDERIARPDDDEPATVTPDELEQADPAEHNDAEDSDDRGELERDPDAGPD
jgi:hypothetical protein